MPFDNFASDLRSKGISDETVCIRSRRGGDTPGYGSKWKIYYRSKNYPDVGVLTTRQSNAEISCDQVTKLTAEIENYKKLRAAGYTVPNCYDEIIEIADNLDGGKCKSALIVEHIDGVGPFKARTEVRSIVRALQMAGLDKDSYVEAWGGLSECAKTIAPNDLQVMFSSGGRIVTIDPEHIGGGQDLPALE